MFEWSWMTARYSVCFGEKKPGHVASRGPTDLHDYDRVPLLAGSRSRGRGRPKAPKGAGDEIRALLPPSSTSEDESQEALSSTSESARLQQTAAGAAVDGQRHTIDEAGAIARKERDRCGELLGAPQSARR